jgi:putative endonuclease
MSSTARGQLGEAIAAQALHAHGYDIVEHNWRCEVGEIDVVAQQGEALVFVEVKLRGGDEYGTAEDSVTAAKQSRLLSAGALYVANHGLGDVDWRIDVVTISLAPSGRVSRINLYKDAVRANGE